MNKRFVVEFRDGPLTSRARRWFRFYESATRADCEAFIEKSIADLPSTDDRHYWGLTRERARQSYRIRGVRVAA